ncbi:MAG TPA: hypothetical protein VH374_18710 [Polyangia bacterium]|jgi:flagellar capping protein FliD|nr:hypothetical protein [Polyangia bacterium]
MSTISLTGLQLFETPLTFQRRSSSGTLPDFLSAAAVAASSLRSTNTASASGAFSVTRTATVDPVHVSSLATAAHAQSSGFSSLDDEVTAGTLALQINGAKYTLNIAQGETLKDVVAGVRGLGAPVDATVESDGGKLRLGITTRATGFKPSGSASDALTVSETDSGSTGHMLGLAVNHQASNAIFTLHGVVEQQTDNHVADTITGASFDLTNPPASTASSGTADATQRSAQLLRGVVGTPIGARISVDSLASAAQVRTSLYASADAAVKSGTLSLNVEGKQTDVTINEGDTLADVRRNIQNSGAAVNATLVNDSGGVRLSIAASATGYPLKGRPEDALTVTEKSTGQGGQSLNPSVTQAATNASVAVDGSTTQSRSNAVTGAIAGFTLNAQHISTTGAEIVTLPGIGGLRPPINVENELNRVLQAQLLKPRDFGVTDATAAKKDDVTAANDPTKSAAARGQTNGGTESSRRDILQKLTAVDDIFGALQAAHALLQAMTSTRTTTPSTSGPGSMSAATPPSS